MIENYLVGALWGLTLSLALTMIGRMFIGPPRVKLEPYWFFEMLFVGCCALLGGLS